MPVVQAGDEEPAVEVDRREPVAAAPRRRGDADDRDRPPRGARRRARQPREPHAREHQRLGIRRAGEAAVGAAAHARAARSASCVRRISAASAGLA